MGMKEMKRKTNHDVSVPRLGEAGYSDVACGEDRRNKPVANPGHENRLADRLSDSEGGENGSVVGCNANNGNASARSANCNNHAGNGWNNYAGAFAVNTEKGESSTSRAASSKTTDSPVATGGQGRCEYDSDLPFMDWDETAESNATATDKEVVFEELKTANERRKLKGLKRFFLNPIIIGHAFDRTVATSSAPKKMKEYYIKRKASVCERIRSELEAMTYEPGVAERRVIHKKGKGDKDRNADVYPMYDRFVQMLILVVIERKLRNMMIRNVYSGIKGRSLLSNDKRYCMVNKIRQWVKGHPDEWVGMTDVYHFYETLRMKIVLGELFNVVVCPFTRWLLVKAFSKTEYLPIGGCLSQAMAMFTLVSADRDLLRKFDVTMFCFGDNRLICGEKGDVRKAMSYLMSYYPARYGLQVKGDYQMRRVKDGFRFCKYDYHGSHVSIRAELRRRAIRAYGKGQQHYAGYKGMLMKTDSKRLRHLIENHYMELTNKHGMKVTTQRGDKVKFRDLENDSDVFPVEYSIEPSEAKAKEGKTGLMVRITYVLIKNGTKRLCHTTEGSEEIVEFFKLVADGKEECHRHLHVRHDGTKSYFAEFHTTKEEACELICDMFNI